MKKTLFITILLLLATIVVGLVIWSDKQAIVEPVVNTNVATTTENLVPSPLTLASLQARPDWNPTMEVEGMKRVEGGVDTLSDPNLMIEKNDLIKLEDESLNKLTTIPSGFSVIHANSFYSQLPEKCRHYTTKDTNKQIVDCVNTPIEYLNELIIVSNDTGEVLHKYKLNEGYSLAQFKESIYEGRVVGVSGFILKKDMTLPINVFKWRDWSDENPEASEVYILNLLTGELKLKFKTPA